MKILHLPLKKKWFDMIASGEKKEEYREIKEYWIKRLFVNHREYFEAMKHMGKDRSFMFALIQFRNGYSGNAPTILIECKGISIGPAKPEWSDNWPGNVFRIKLGEIIPDSEEIEDGFARCSDCDGHDACADFGCAIKHGLGHMVSDIN